MRALYAVVTSALLLSLTACGGSGNKGVAFPDSLPPLTKGIPFPEDRGVSALTEYVLNGAAADLSSAGAVPSGTAMVLSAEVGGYEYALYRFNPTGEGAGAPDSVSVLLEDGVTTEAWIGRADYNAGVWQFEGPFTKPKTLLLDDAKYISPDGNVWVAVVVAAEQSATVNALSVRTINLANQPPSAALDADVTSGNAPLTVSFDASGSADPDGTIIEYAWDFDGDGLYDGFSDDPQVSREYTSPGLFTVKVRVTDDQFARATATVEINVNVVGNDPPVADLSASPDSGEAPLSVTLDASDSNDPDGSIVKYEWDFDGNGIWDGYGDSSSATHTYTAAGLFDAKVRVTDDKGAQDIATVQVKVGNDPPVANLNATPTSGEPPLEVSFDATGSYDPDGTIVDYEWDFDGNGVFNETGDEAGAQGNPTPTVTYGTPGETSATVRVTDNEGKTDVASQSITATGWLILTIDSDDDVGTHSSLAVINGNPSISYRDSTNGNLKYTYSSTVDGSSGWTVISVETSGSVGYSSLAALLTGPPAISYYDSTNQDLQYAFSATLDGSPPGWMADITVDSAGDVGYYTSLAMVGGNPAISYLDSTNNDLKYAYSTFLDGFGGWTDIAVDTTGSVGQYTSLAVVGGTPAISYLDSTNNDLKFAYSTVFDGSGGWTAIAVDTTGSVGQYTSLAVVNDKPAISYYDVTNLDLKYAYSSTVDGSSGWSTVTVDAVGNVGEWTSLAVLQTGQPAISYYDDTNDDLKYAVLYE